MMYENLKQKIVIIIGVLAVFLYGAFFGFDPPKFEPGQPLLSQLTQHIHRGLDLQGGVHLILQVQVKEAVGTETDNSVARIEQDLKTAKLTVLMPAFAQAPIKSAMLLYSTFLSARITT